MHYMYTIDGCKYSSKINTVHTEEWMQLHEKEVL